MCSAQPVWRDKLMNVQKYIRGFRSHEHDQISEQPMCSVAHLGLDLLRIDTNLNLRCNLATEQCIEDIKKSIYFWTKGLVSRMQPCMTIAIFYGCGCESRRSPITSLLRLTRSLLGLLTMTMTLCSPWRIRTLACYGVSSVWPTCPNGLRCFLTNLPGGRSHI